VRLYLSVTAYGDAAELLVKRTVLEAAETMSDPADLINRSIEALQAASIDLPAFSTLDRLVNRLRAEVHARIYNYVSMRVTTEHLTILDALLVRPANSTTTSFNRLKQTPGPATPTTHAPECARVLCRGDRRRLHNAGDGGVGSVPASSRRDVLSFEEPLRNSPRR
jgi:hypothetical protein